MRWRAPSATPEPEPGERGFPEPSSCPARMRRRAAVLVPVACLLAGLAAAPAEADHSVSCGGESPRHGNACTKRFVAEADVFELEGDHFMEPGVVVAILSDLKEDVAVTVCYGWSPAVVCKFSPHDADAFAAGETLTMWGFAQGSGGWVVRARYVT